MSRNETLACHSEGRVSRLDRLSAKRRSYSVEMSRGEVLRDRTTAGIIDSAAMVLAERGEAASMEEIASSAGIGRATLYRYFPNREELLGAIAAASVQEPAARVKEADLEAVHFQAATARHDRCVIDSRSQDTTPTREGDK